LAGVDGEHLAENIHELIVFQPASACEVVAFPEDV
jgi:hypothetical protein